MAHDSSSITPPSSTSRLGDRIRSIAQQLRQEDEVQIHTTSRILGAAAQIAQNHDRLIDEVVDMVEEDLIQSQTAPPTHLYTVEQLKKDFNTIKDAKAHFNLKARSWDALVDKLNQQSSPASEGFPKTAPQPSTTIPIPSRNSSSSVDQRLERIEQALQSMRHDLKQLTQLMLQRFEQKS